MEVKKVAIVNNFELGDIVIIRYFHKKELVIVYNGYHPSWV